jgi:hypothetical protein
MVGRDREMAAVAALLDAVPLGPCGLVLEGAAGIGKTTVWRAGAAQAVGRSYTVLSCRPAESEATLSFAALGDLLDGILDRALPDLSPPQRRALEVVPILPGRTADARDFMRELESDRNADYQHSEQRIGITKEAWYLARTPAGDQLVAYMESPDFAQALLAFSQSQDQFDQWFKQRLADATGLDLNAPPTAPLPKLLSSYPANGRH